MTVNKKYKDSLFRSIFNNKERLLELYNGKEDYPAKKVLKLSELVKKKKGKKKLIDVKVK